MPVQALTQTDPAQFFRLPSANSAGTQQLKTQVSGIAVSNDLSGRLSVTTAEGDTITLTADFEYDFRAVNYSSQVAGDGSTVNLDATHIESTLKKEFGVTVDGDLNQQELSDLEKLFRKVSSIFKGFFRGDDEVGLTKTAKLAERLELLPSLSGLDLNLDVQRSVTVLAARIASEVTGQPSSPIGQESPSATTSLTGTPGGASATEAVIPPPSTGITAPTPASSAAASANSLRVSAPAQDRQQTSLLVQQVLDALRDTKTESHTIKKYLPDFLDKLREDLVKELRGEREQQNNHHAQPANQTLTPAETSSGAVFAYRTTSQISVSLSIHG
jgi:hypothetical protein